MENIKVYEKFMEEAQKMLPQLIKTRRNLHTYAETGWREIRTTSLIAQRLTELGIDEVLTGEKVCKADARMGLPSPEVLDKEYERAIAQGAIQPFAQKAKAGFTGVIGMIYCGEGPVIALRFDIDALGVYEDAAQVHLPAREGFRSVNEGMMHACGHDGHTAIGLAVAELLMEKRELLHGTIKLIFQPAEEGVRGAKAIVEKGHLDDVNFVIGNHMANNNGSDEQVTYSTGGMLATSKLDVSITGKAAHAGAAPEKGDNAMLAAATAILNLHSIPRSGQGATRVNVGILRAGSGRNVICDRAEMEVEVRGASTEINNFMENYARRIIKAAAEMHGCTYDIKLAGKADSLTNDKELMELCDVVCKKNLHLKMATPVPRGGGSEDFAFMINRVREHGGKGLFFKTLTPCSAPFHSNGFDFKENAMVNGVAIFCGLVYKLMHK